MADADPQNPNPELPGDPKRAMLRRLLWARDQYVKQSTPDDITLTERIAAALGQFAHAPPPPDASPTAAHLLLNLAALHPETIQWLWPGRVPLGKLTLLAGDPGLGKSLLTLDLAARLSRGQSPPSSLEGEGDRRDEGNTLILSAEDGLADTIVPRLLATGADLARISALPLLPRFRLDRHRTLGYEERLPSFPDDLPVLEEAVVASGARLVVVDPLNAYFAGGVNSWRDQDVRRALAPLATLAERTGAAVLVVAHLNKASARSALYRVGGSIGIPAAARSVLLVAPDPDDPTRRVVASLKCNLATSPPALAFRVEAPASTGGVPRLAWDGTSPHGADALLALQGNGDAPSSALRPPQSALEEARAFLTQLLAAGPLPAAELLRQAQEAGIPRLALRRARLLAGVRIHKDGYQGPWLWHLPPEPPPLP